MEVGVQRLGKRYAAHNFTRFLVHIKSTLPVSFAPRRRLSAATVLFFVLCVNRLHTLLIQRNLSKTVTRGTSLPWITGCGIKIVMSDYENMADR